MRYIFLFTGVISVFTFSVITLFALPTLAFGQVVFSEIMYDLEGTDGGYEWIEVFNGSDVEVDLSLYKLFENNVKHKISNGLDETIAPNGYAIIADNPAKFLEKNPIFSRVLYDSAFSLNNTGETFQLFNPEDIEIDSATYTSEMGANGTGNSLQVHNGDWIAAAPTPGSANATEPVDESVASDDTDTSGPDSDTNSNDSSLSSNTSSGSSGSSSHSNQVPLSNEKQNDYIKIGIGRERIATVKSEIKFSIISKEKVDKVEWSFGDGFSRTGDVVRHVYTTPGTYHVVANARSDKRHSVARTVVKVIDADIEFGETGAGVFIKNNASSEVNVGGFTVEYGNKRHVMSEDTIIGGGSTVVIPEHLMSLKDVDNVWNKTSLSYADGTLHTDLSFKHSESYSLEKIDILCRELLVLGISCVQ